ncbi:VWFA and cache domain-containing protein 1-like [Mya arenaria]|uniref:VWFA and cache domain-containing protein 1-like n=1 Tax=Mya arenaria TaxID=6604 RepID=UPI0022E06A7A|nr:VWFA and cache domain-containing protein 1-like [Mya arenaria]
MIDSTKMSSSLCFVLLLSLNVLDCSDGKTIIDESTWNEDVDSFKQEMDTHIDKVLAYNEIGAMLEKHENELTYVRVSGSEEFEKLFQKVSTKYNDLVSAANSLKTIFEMNLRKDSKSLRKKRQYFSSINNSLKLKVDKNIGLKGLRSFPGNSPKIVKRSATADIYQKNIDFNPENVSEDENSTSATEESIVTTKIIPTQQETSLPFAGPPTIPRPDAGVITNSPILEPPTLEPKPPLPHCCGDSASGVYDGRLREEVIYMPCGVNVTLGDSGNVDAFKEKFQDIQASYRHVHWQYFIEADGGFVQYPSNTRQCLSEGGNRFDKVPWLVEKFFMEKRNLVIFIDNSGDGETLLKPLFDGAKRVIANTLAWGDKINVVDGDCSGSPRFLVRSYEKGLVDATMDAKFQQKFDIPPCHAYAAVNLTEGLAKVYELFEQEMDASKRGFNSRSNVVLTLIKGDDMVIEKESLLPMVAEYQQKLNSTIQHLIYVTRNVSQMHLEVLAQLADQNNLKLHTGNITAKSWSGISGLNLSGPIGKEGWLEVVDIDGFADSVETYFKKIPPQMESTITANLVVGHGERPLGMTVNIPVYKDQSSLPLGIAGVEGSLAAVFTDIVNCNIGDKSYCYMVDTTYDDVLIHPKLGDISEYVRRINKFSDIETDLNEQERESILTSSFDSTYSFDTMLPAIHPEVEGELIQQLNITFETATVYSRKLRGTTFIVVFVHFQSDRMGIKYNVQSNISADLHGVYHRLDVLFGSPEANVPEKEEVCRLEGHFVSFQQSVIKLVPTVFQDPELYKYSQETVTNSIKLNQFVSKGIMTDLLDTEKTDMLLHTLRATDELDALWSNHKFEVIERFYGSSSGVFRMYPGSPMLNTFDHRQTNWYRKSMLFPNTTLYHRGKLGFINKQDVIIITRTVQSVNGRKLGVVGMTITSRTLTSLFSKSVPACFQNDTECFVVDNNGFTLNDDKRWMSANLPWAMKYNVDHHPALISPQLINQLYNRHMLKWNGCESFSDGFSKKYFSVAEGSIYSNTTYNGYAFTAIPDTNIFLLLLLDKDNRFPDNFPCYGCTRYQSPIGEAITGLPSCLGSGMPSKCVLQCFQTACVNDDYCYKPDITTGDTYGAEKIRNSCFVTPVASKQFMPDSPGPMHGLERCPIPCAAIDDMDICAGLSHCEANEAVYSTCNWKGNYTDVDRYFPSPPAGSGAPTLQTKTDPFKISTTTEGVLSYESNATMQTSTDAAKTTLSAAGVSEHLTSVSTGASISASNEHRLNAGDRMSPGSIVALVVGLIVFVGILVIIGVKLYTKMFIRSQGLNRGTFSDVFYNRRNERVDMNNKTSTPYSELEN